MKQDFYNRAKEYFKEDYASFIEELSKPCSHGFFLNTLKGDSNELLKHIDFDYQASNMHPNSFIHHNLNIGKTIAYELGLIYPQDIESSLFVKFLDNINPKLIVDMCAAPGGKSIVTMNRFKDAYLIANEITSSRVSALTSNIERMGIDNCSVTSKDTSILADDLKGNVDLVLLDAPCSGEGMIRKYPQILEEYSVSNIQKLSSLQKTLLENAYLMLKKDGYLVYSTCTYAFEEDEDNIQDFLSKHLDCELVYIDVKNNHSTLKGTIKLSPLNGSEGQFIAIIHKNEDSGSNNLHYLKSLKNKIVDDFIKDNLNIDNYYLYENNKHFYLSFNPLIDFKKGMIRSGIYLGEIIKDRFEPNHSMYRANSLINKFKYVKELNDNEYKDFIKGLQMKGDYQKAYYLLTYKGYPLGFGKATAGILKNKYPKGLRSNGIM